MFRIGTLVSLTNKALSDAIGIGTVVNVIRSDSDLPDFHLYDVDFASGLRTLQGSELAPISIGISFCGEREHLLLAHTNAFDIYIRGVRELAKAAGVMARAEFEFLANKVGAARQAWLETRERLNQHTAQHGC